MLSSIIGNCLVTSSLGSAVRTDMGAFARLAITIIGSFTQPSNTRQRDEAPVETLSVPKLSFTCQVALFVRQCSTQCHDIPVLIADRMRSERWNTLGTASLNHCRHTDAAVSTSL